MANSRIIAFYLPQYHPIPENDEWWGKGFTDWRNVIKGKPRFLGHYQPHIPADLGIYDLRLEDTRIAQAEMAKEYGISGFCYYHFWFNGKMLLETPFNEVLNSGKPDFPFCLCWANENWTKRWDGLDQEILMEQNYDKYDSEQHFIWLEKAFSDKRYIKINGKPLFLIYNTTGIPKLADKIKLWRKLSREKGFPDLFLCSVKSIHNTLSDSEVIALGFDALVDFVPNNHILNFRKSSGIPKYYIFALINKLISVFGLSSKVSKLPLTSRFDYGAIVNDKIINSISEYKAFPCIMPSWDNSARKKLSNVIYNEDPEVFGKWLENAIEKVSTYHAEEQIVFVNAWNEWAEGCHLEPDLKNGKRFLETILNIVKKHT